jgi:hypothetical protein
MEPGLQPERRSTAVLRAAAIRGRLKGPRPPTTSSLPADTKARIRPVSCSPKEMATWLVENGGAKETEEETRDRNSVMVDAKLTNAAGGAV